MIKLGANEQITVKHTVLLVLGDWLSFIQRSETVTSSMIWYGAIHSKVYPPTGGHTLLRSNIFMRVEQSSASVFSLPSRLLVGPFVSEFSVVRCVICLSGIFNIAIVWHNLWMYANIHTQDMGISLNWRDLFITNFWERWQEKEFCSWVYIWVISVELYS